MGTETERLMSFFGNIDDPGILFIVAAYLLQEKYKKKDCDLEISVSFIEILDGKFYDLLVTGRQPLMLPRKQNRKLIGCTDIKFGNYTDFLKLLRTALFNNRQRDLGEHKSQFCQSIFVVHFTVSCPETSTVISLVDWPKLEKLQRITTKLQWTYISKYGQLKIIYSIPTLEQTMETNLEKYEKLNEIVHLKKSSQVVPCLSDILNKMSNLQQFILTTNYNSLKHLSRVQQILASRLDSMTQNCQSLSNIVVKLLLESCRLKLLKNYNMIKCKTLIGSTVKTDGIKQFYSCRSYQSLRRQVQSMTEEIEEEVKENYNLLGHTVAKLRKSAELFKIAAVPQQSQIEMRVQSQLSQLYKTILHFYMSKQRQIVEFGQYWLEQVKIKNKLQKQTEAISQKIQKIKEITKDIRNYKCSFKQEDMLSENNIFSKLMRKMDGKVTSLPRLLFRKMEQKVVESREEKRNRHLAKDVSLLLLRPA